MTPEPMSLRSAVEALKAGIGDDCASVLDSDIARAVAIVDAAVEAHEAMPARLLAAWRAGRDAAAKACEGECRGYYPHAMGPYSKCITAIRALPDPSPTELEQL